MKIVNILFILFIGISASAQEFKDFMTDQTWAFYNRNIQCFNNQRLGESLKYGLDEQYVDNIISEDHPMYHEIGAFYKETYSYVDFSKKVNEPYYKFEFDKNQNLTVQEVLFYMADKYAAYFEGPDRLGYLGKEDIQNRIEEYALKSSKKIVLREFWFFHNNLGKMVSRIMDIGFIPDNSKSDAPVLWIDFSYMKFSKMERIRPKNMDGITNLIDYLEQPTFTRDFYSVNYSTYPEQKKLYKFSTQVDANFWKQILEQNFRSYVLDPTIKKKWKKNKVKTKWIQGEVTEQKELEGTWNVNDTEGKLKASYTYKNKNVNGQYKLYYDNGKLKEKGQMVDGRKNDTIYNYYSNGQLLSWQVYKTGWLNGQSKFYHKNGALHSACEFENDTLINEFKSFYADGTPKTSGQCKNGYFQGSWIFNVKLNEVMCGYLRDENDYSLLSNYFEMNALDDCTATFEIYFKQRFAKDCYRGVCVIPEFNSLIR